VNVCVGVKLKARNSFLLFSISCLGGGIFGVFKNIFQGGED